MCGRTRCSLAPQEILGAANVEEHRWKNKENYKLKQNAGPGSWLPVIKAGEDGQTELHTMKWGLIPGYTRAGERLDYFKMFNARSETLAESPVFKRLLPSQRCICIVNGFYEWHQETDSRKQPYYVSFGEEQIMKLAALFDSWLDTSTDEKLYTCTIITTQSSSRIKWLHNRMPVILESSAREADWLDKQNSAFPEKFFDPCNSCDLVWHPVTPAIGKLSFQDPECHKDVRKKGISRFFKAVKEKSDNSVVVKDESSDVPSTLEEGKVGLGQEAESDGRKRKWAQEQTAVLKSKKRPQATLKQFFAG